jgi:hypothetical protein
MLEHVSFDIATASNGAAARIEADPVFTFVVTFVAQVEDRCAFEGFFGGDVVGGAMGTVFFGNDRV